MSQIIANQDSNFFGIIRCKQVYFRRIITQDVSLSMIFLDYCVCVCVTTTTVEVALESIKASMEIRLIPFDRLSCQIKFWYQAKVLANFL